MDREPERRYESIETIVMSAEEIRAAIARGEAELAFAERDTLPAPPPAADE